MNANVKIAFGFILGAAAGAAVAWKVTSIQLNEQFSAIVEHELAATKDFYERSYKVGKYESPETTVAELKDQALEDAVAALHSYISESNDEENVVTESNIFEDAEADDDPYRQLLLTRDTNRPYVITFDEFSEGREDNGAQNTITWYTEDEVLADERDQMIPNIDKTVGNDNLDKFGMNENDPNIIYVRNDQLGCDFEVLREEASYAVVVHGYAEPPLKGKRPKFRGDDD